MGYLTPTRFAEVYGGSVKPDGTRNDDGVPRYNLDCLIVSPNQQKVLLSQRKIEPNLGQHHLPGGSLWRGERLVAAANRILNYELKLVRPKVLGVAAVMNFPAEQRGDVSVHTVSNVIVVEADQTMENPIPNSHTKSLGWYTFNNIPENTIAEHLQFLGYAAKFVEKGQLIPVLPIIEK
jgi:ADP-ribose pyrophosphatase YjhB (NUDIX family)